MMEGFFSRDTDVKSEIHQDTLDDQRLLLNPRKVFEQLQLNAGHISREYDRSRRFVRCLDDCIRQRVGVQIVAVVNCGEATRVFVGRQSQTLVTFKSVDYVCWSHVLYPPFLETNSAKTAGSSVRRRQS